MGWTATFNATGPRGPGIVSGSGAPTSSAGAVNDFYLDTSTSGGPYLYGPKTSSGWPSASISLLGATGAAGPQFLFGTTQPGSPSFGGLNVGDFYLRTDTSILYQLQRVSGSATMVQIGSFLGGTGPQGLSVLSGSGAPSSSLGVVNQPAYYDTTNGFLYGAKTSSGWPSSYVNLNGAVGQQGASIRTGGGAPTSSIGNVGDVYIDTASYNAPVFYAAKTSSGWPSTGTSLIGSAGLSVLTGSGAPASSLGAQGQTYIDTTALALYVKGSSAWGSAQSLVGSAGAKGDQGAVGSAGLSVLSASGAPASSTGVVGQPAYLDTAAAVLYAAKTSSGWPSSGVSLNGLSIRNGSGAPTSSKPATQFDGDFYVDTSANVIYGPRVSGSWPSSGVSFAGNTFRTGQGVPASSLGAIGDLYVDGTAGAGTLYLKGSSGWATTGGSLLGPQGSTGATGFTSLTNQASCYGGYVTSVGVSLTSTAQVMQANSTLPASVVLPQASAFMGCTVVNNTSSAVTVSLYDTVAGKNIWSSGSIGANSNYTTSQLSATAYPLTANNLYQWMISGGGTSNVQVNPCYLMPSVLTSSGSGILSGYTTPASTTLSSTVQYFIPGQKVASSSSSSRGYTPLRSAQMLGGVFTYVPSAAGAASATATITVYTYAQSGGSGGTLTSFSVTNTGTPQVVTLSSALTLSTGITYYCGVTGSGTGTVDAQFFVSV